MLHLFDEYLRESTTIPNATDSKFIEFVKLLAKFRKNEEENEDVCLERLLEQSKSFLTVLKNRTESSEQLTDLHYWGSKQQLLAGKVVADWVAPESGPLDPVFGVLLVPTAGMYISGLKTLFFSFLRSIAELFLGVYTLYL